MRISTSQIYANSLRQINSALSDYSLLNQMNSSQKKLMSASDDPWGAAKVVELQSANSQLQAWIENCGFATDMLSSMDSALQDSSEIITSALEVCEQGSTGTYTTAQLRSMAIEVRQYAESLMTAANTELGGDSLFAGNDLAGDAYDIALGVTIDDPSLSASNVGLVTGEVDTSVWVQFDTGGTVGTDALTYRWSEDGGTTWTSATLAIGDTTLVCGDCSLTLTAGSVVTAADGEGEGAGLIIREAMVYAGSSRNMTMSIAEDSTVETTLVGSEVFGGRDASGDAYEEPNLFETLSDLAAYMDIGDTDAVAECLEKLEACQVNLTTANARVGAIETRVTYAESEQSVLSELVDNAISNREDADATQILIELNEAQYVYQAVLSSTADIMQMSILSYI